MAINEPRVAARLGATLGELAASALLVARPADQDHSVEQGDPQVDLQGVERRENRRFQARAAMAVKHRRNAAHQQPSLGLTQDRAQIAQELVDREGLTLIPPFAHPDVITGQGTAALELFQDVPDLQQFYVPLGGGGLLSGCLLAAKAMA